MILTKNNHKIIMNVYTFVNTNNNMVTIVGANREAAYLKLEEQGKKRKDWKLLNQ
jgi:hypothetical protein